MPIGSRLTPGGANCRDLLMAEDGPIRANWVLVFDYGNDRIDLVRREQALRCVPALDGPASGRDCAHSGLARP